MDVVRRSIAAFASGLDRVAAFWDGMFDDVRVEAEELIDVGDDRVIAIVA